MTERLPEPPKQQLTEIGVILERLEKEREAKRIEDLQQRVRERIGIGKFATRVANVLEDEV